MERVKFIVKVFDNFLEIIPEEPIKPNSHYEIRLKDIKSADGKKVLESEKINVFTKMKPFYSTVEAVKSVCQGCEPPDHLIMYHIREASRYANYLKKTDDLEIRFEQTSGFDDELFEVQQFVKYHAAYHCLLSAYVDKASNAGLKGKLGEIEFENPAKMEDISKILKDLRGEIDKWNLALQGHSEFRAGPKTGVKSKNAHKSIYTKHKYPGAEIGNPSRRSYMGDFKR